MAQIAAAWVMQRDGVCAPIVGTTSLRNLEELVGEFHCYHCAQGDQNDLLGFWRTICSCSTHGIDTRGDEISRGAVYACTYIWACLALGQENCQEY